MAALDVILAAVLAVSVLLGLWRGLLYEALSLLTWIAAYMVAQRWAGDAAERLPLADWSDPLRYAAGFVVLFVVALFAGGLLAWLVRLTARSVGLRPMDRVLGAAFGAVRGVLILMATALLVQHTPWVDSPVWREAAGPRWLDYGLAAVKGLVPARLAVYFP